MKKSNILFIFQTGYGLLSLPLSLFSFATTIYYLLINNVPFLKEIFPRFEGFLVLGFIIGVPFTLLVGRIYIKSELNKASTRVHPYSTRLIPAQIPMYRGMANLCRLHGLKAEAAELDALIEKSMEDW